VLDDNQNNSKANIVSNYKNWCLPVDAEILKKFSIENNHPGLTYGSELGQDVRAVRKGKVVYSGDKMTSYGKMIIIKHAYGFYSIYNQNQEIYVSEGDSIEKGQVIAITGNNPFYFEMKKYEEPINPLRYQLIKNFIYNNVNLRSISHGGQAVLFDKIKKAPYRLFLIILDYLALPFSMPIVVLIRLIKPLYHIRLGYFYGGRIGHFAYDTAMAATMIDKEVKCAYLFYFLPNISNKQWAKMVKRELNVYYWVRLLSFANSIIPGGKEHSVIPGVNQEYTSRDLEGLIYHSDFEFKFTDNETKAVKIWLQEKGWKDGDKIICVQVRDNQFLPTKNWAYHDYRDSDINTYVPAMELLAKKGYWVIRMGKTMKEPIKTSHSQIIDYAFDKQKNDLIDVWLFANCELCITTGSGPDAISCVYRRPLLHINSLPLTHIESYSNVMHIPKNLYWKRTGLLLTFREYCENDFFHSQVYEQKGIEIVDLSPEEITAAVLEKIEAIEGKNIETKEDTLLQNMFWDTGLKIKNFSSVNGFIHPEARISLSFVKSHPNWLH
jgi:putative glycosyltransferase (TIGR04372 family)